MENKNHARCRNCHFLETTRCETPLYWCGCPSKKSAQDHISWVKFNAEGCSSYEARQDVLIVIDVRTPPTEPAPTSSGPKKSLEECLIKVVAVASMAIMAAKLLGGEIPPDWHGTIAAFFAGASGKTALIAGMLGTAAGLIARWGRF
jgi:hypothetical protein